ncbi:MAG: hypothetical protein ACREEK_09865 [Bradyrhizobium sp.]
MTSTIISLIAEWSAIATERYLSRLAASFPEPALRNRGQAPVNPTEPVKAAAASDKTQSAA